MSGKLFVGSLPYTLDDSKLKEIFSESGVVISAKVIVDRMDNRSKGFGFVEMSGEDAKKAIRELNNKKIEDRTIIVKLAHPREDRTGDSSGGGFGRKTRKFTPRRY
jgi:RNA recognition motif-containing protein